MDLHIPIWLAKGLLALILVFGFFWLAAKYQAHPKAKYAVYAATAVLLWAGCYWLVSLI